MKTQTFYLPLPKNADRLIYVRGLLSVNRIKSRHIARKLGVQESAVSRVLHGTMKSFRIKKAIADELNMTFEAVWGESEDNLIFTKNYR